MKVFEIIMHNYPELLNTDRVRLCQELDHLEITIRNSFHYCDIVNRIKKEPFEIKNNADSISIARIVTNPDFNPDLVVDPKFK